ncbi:MAG: DinB family protein, partial [Sediminibacterium sp.]|nr:DinB family protein [Sediminibacterium sp.]
MKKTIMISCILIFFCSTVGIAQTVAPDSVKAQLIKDWERAKTYTAEYLAAMPADKYTAKPVEGIRSFAEQMLHLAQGSI